MSSPNPSRFPRGLNNQVVQDRLGLYGLPDPTRWITYFTDFAGNVGVPQATNIDYIVTKTGAGVLSNIDGSGGLLYLSNATGSDDAIWVQRSGEPFRFDPAKKMMFVARLKVADATGAQFAVGLTITDTTPLDVTDGIFFIKPAGAVNATLRVEKGDVAVVSANIPLANDTFIELAWVYNGSPYQSSTNVTTYDFDVFVNGVYSSTVQASTTAPNTEDLTVTFGVQNSGTTAVSKNATFDYILAALERS